MNSIHNTIDLRKSGENTPTLTHIPTEWDDSDLGDFHYTVQTEKKMSGIVKFFFLSFTVFLLAVSFAAYTFLTNKNVFNDQKIDFVITPPVSVGGGEEISLPIMVGNRNGVPILSSYVVISYDAGENSSGAGNITTKKVDLGDIVSNSNSSKSINISLFGNEGDTRKISAKLFYSLSGTKAVYNKNLDDISIAIKSSPVTLTINSLKEMIVGREYSYDIFIKNNTEKEINNLLISVRPPNDFVFSTSSQALHNKNPSWLIKSLPRNAETKISFTGKLVGSIGTQENFTFYAGVSGVKDVNVIATGTAVKSKPTSTSITRGNFDNFDLNLDNVYTKAEKSILLAGQFLDVKVEDDSTFGKSTVGAGENISLIFKYKNNLNYPIDKATFTAKLSGNMIDTQNVIAEDGDFDQESMVAVWNAGTKGELSQLAANAVGTFRLSVRVSRAYIANGNIKLELEAKGERNAEDGVPNVQDISLTKSWNVSK